MTEYKTDTGMIYAVRKQSPGKYRIMCKYDKSRFGWAVATAPEFSAECNIAESLQEVLDAYAQRRGWEEVDKPNPCDGCRCKTCADPSCLQAHCGGSDHGFACIQEDGCYTPESCTSTAAPDAGVQPGDVFKAPNGTLYKIADKLIDKQRCWHTVRFDPSTCEWLAVNSTVYDNLENALGEFATWIRTENLKPVARNGAAATAAAEEPASPPAEPAPANTTAEPAAGGSEPEENALAEHPVTSELSQQPAAFDYSGLDAQTVADLHLAEREYASGKRMAEMGLRRMADGVAIAHEALCVTDATICRNGETGKFSKPDQAFGAWCESVGINRKAAERLLQVSRLFDGSSPRQQKVLEELSPSLLYAAAKPSAPAELVQAVKSGDITTHKQYQDLLAQLKAKSDELAAEKTRADSLSAEIGAREEKISELLEASEQADQRANQAETRIKGLEDSYRSAHANEEFAIRRAADAEARAKHAEQKAAELEARPIEVAVQQPSDADLARWRAEGAEQARREAAASIASADSARKKAEDRIKKLQETLQGRTDHLNAVETELAQLKAQLKTAPSSKPAPGCAPACIPCTECAYEDSCCGLSFLGDIPEEDDAINARLTGCTAGKRKGRPA